MSQYDYIFGYLSLKFMKFCKKTLVLTSYFFFSLCFFSFLVLRLRFMKVRSLDTISQTMKLSSFFFSSLFLSLLQFIPSNTMSSRSLIFCTSISNLQLMPASEFLSTDNICLSLGVWLNLVLCFFF